MQEEIALGCLERWLGLGGHGAGADLFAHFAPEADIVACGAGVAEELEADVALLRVGIVAADAALFDEGKEIVVERLVHGIHCGGEGGRGDDEPEEQGTWQGKQRHVGGRRDTLRGWLVPCGGWRNAVGGGGRDFDLQK